MSSRARPGKHSTRSAATRKRRAARRTLWEIQPGGYLYHDWLTVGDNAQEWADTVATYSGLDASTIAITAKVPYLAQHYGGHVPMQAALALDFLIEYGSFLQLCDSGPDAPPSTNVREVPIETLDLPELRAGGMSVRDRLHSLHARGMLIMETEAIVALGTPWYLKDRKRRVAAGLLDDPDGEE